MAYIRFENVNKSFGTNHVLKDINLDVEKGELVTLLGPSGCGKSTLLRCLSGLEQVTSGRIYLDGEDITDVSPRRRGIGMVFQQYSLFPNMSVKNNVAFGLKMKGTPKNEIDERVKEMLDIVGLSEKIDQFPMQLSGGQQQRVALARALTQEPKILLADEPVASLDPATTIAVRNDFVRINKMGITIIANRHHVDLAKKYSTRIIGVRAGQIVFDGKPEEVTDEACFKIYGRHLNSNENLGAKLDEIPEEPAEKR